MAAKAEESRHIKRVREKVRSHIEEENKQITPKALQDAHETIHRWLYRHQGERKNLKSKHIEMFDENKHTARVSSQYVLHLQKMIETGHPLKPLKPLKKSGLAGRIKMTTEEETEEEDIGKTEDADHSGLM